MSNPILPFGSGDSSVVFEHSLKTPLDNTDVGVWNDVFRVGSDSQWSIETSYDSGSQYWPTHDSELGMIAVSQTDGVTEACYWLLAENTDQAVIDLDKEGCLMFEIESEFLDTYDVTDNPTAPRLTDDPVVPVSFFSSGGNDNIFPLRRDGTRDLVEYYGMTNAATVKEIESTYDGQNVTDDNLGTPRFVASSHGRGRFTRVIIAWRGLLSWVAFQDPDDPDAGAFPVAHGIMARPAADTTLVAKHIYIGSSQGTLNTFLDQYYIRNLTLSTKCPSFTLSRKFRKVLFFSDSMIDYADHNSIAKGGVNGTKQAILRAFGAKGLYTLTDVSEHAGARLDESIVVTPSSITRSGTTATLTTSSDPGWLTSDQVAIAGADQPEYNGIFSVTRNSPTEFEYTMTADPGATASGTITAGRSIQVSAQNLMNLNPDAAGAVIHALTNDLNSSETAADSLVDYKSLIDKIGAQANMKFIIIIKPPARLLGGDLDLQEEYNSDVFEQARQYAIDTYSLKAEIADVWRIAGERDSDDYLDSDNIHYNAKGCAAAHWAIYKAMLRIFNRS